MWNRTFKRLGRSFIALGAGVLIAYVSGSPYALVFAPVLSALGKWLRERGIVPVPF